ncbi:MAG: DEAD/DEAH box helicase [bacterium]|nr:DEAD/DEAH box helicase [bacterium]
MSFEDFGLDERSLNALSAEGISEPTPIQEQTIPIALSGRDVVAIAQTGTGKTLAFSLPSLSRLAQGRIDRNMMLVLTPTRELAVQVHSVVETFGNALGIRSVCLYGGVGLEPQAKALRRGVGVVVATPGRLLDHMSRGNVQFNKLMILVLDEADRMLDMGFLPDIRRIMSRVPTNRQTIMSSATFPREIERLANQMLHDPERVVAGAISKPVDQVIQQLYTVDRASKQDLLKRVLRDEEIESGLIFLRTKARTERVTRSLRRAGFKAQGIHGDRTQAQREQALEGFRKGRYRLLVATDVAARGLDIQGISHVINYDIPENADDYIHRIGRTARANATGHAVTFVSPDEHTCLEAIEQSLGEHIPKVEWEGAVNVLSLFRTPEEKAERARKGLSRRGRSRGLLRRR